MSADYATGRADRNPKRGEPSATSGQDGRGACRRAAQLVGVAVRQGERGRLQPVPPSVRPQLTGVGSGTT